MISDARLTPARIATKARTHLIVRAAELIRAAWEISA